MNNRPPLSAFTSEIGGDPSSFPILNENKPQQADFTQEQPEELGYFSRVGREYSQAGQDIMSGIQKGAEQYASGIEQGGVGGLLKSTGGLLRSGLRTAGGVARAAFSPITEAPVVKQAIEIAGKGISKIPGVERVTIEAQNLSKKYPEAAKDIQNLVDLAIVAGGGSKATGSALTKAGEALTQAGAKAATVSRMKFAEDLVMPFRTEAVKKAQVARTTEQGFFKKDIITPTGSETRSIQEVANIPGVKKGNTYQKNWNIINEANIQKAQELEKLVDEKDFAIPKKEILARLEDTKSELANSPLIVGDAQKTAEKMLVKARQIIEENAGTGKGLLKARKEFDQWVQKQKPKIFDASSENAMTTSNRAIRDSLNQIFDEKATAAGLTGTAEARASQSALYRALDNIEVKAAKEADTAFGRSLQRIGETLGTRNKLVQTLAAATGIGVFGAATAYALPLTLGTAGGWLLYKGGRLVMKPEVRTAVGDLLAKYGEQIAPVDRAILEGLLQDFQDYESSSGKNLENTNSASKNGIQNDNIPSLESFNQ